MANDDQLVEAIRLIKAGQKDAARALLEPFLLRNPGHIQAWMWETELFSSDREKAKVLEACLKQNPGNTQVIQALIFFSKRAETNVRAAQPKPAPSYAPPPVYPEPKPSSYQTPAPAKAASPVSPFSGSLDLSGSTNFIPEPQRAETVSVALEKPVRPQPLPQGDVKPPKKKRKPLSQAARTAILVGLGIVVCIALTGFYIGGGYYLNGQVDQAFAAQDCASVAQNATFVTLYPQAIFGSLFSGHGEFSQCRSKLDMEQAIKDKNWEQATSIAQGYLAAYPNGTFTASFKEQAPKVLATWAGELVASHNYTEGIEKSKQLITTYPDSPSAKSAPDDILQTYLLWAKGLSDKQAYKDAESTLNLALGYFKTDSARSDQVKQELSSVYVAWGDSQVQNGDTDGATATYTKAAKASPEVDVNLLIARANLQNAVEISKTKNFNKALEKVKEISDAAQADNVKAEANTTRDNILKAYSESSSPQAVDQLTAAISLSCQGQRPDLPIFGLDAEKVRFGFSNPFVQLPLEITAAKPGELHYVICVTETEDTIETCKYTGNHKIARIRYVWQTTLYDILSGTVYNTTTINGADPKACPPAAYLVVGSGTSKSYGLRPTSDQLVEWLTNLNLIK